MCSPTCCGACTSIVERGDGSRSSRKAAPTAAARQVTAHAHEHAHAQQVIDEHMSTTTITTATTTITATATHGALPRMRPLTAALMLARVARRCRSAASAIPKGSKPRSTRGLVHDEAQRARLAASTSLHLVLARSDLPVVAHARRRAGARRRCARVARARTRGCARRRETQRAAPADRADGPLARATGCASRDAGDARRARSTRCARADLARRVRPRRRRTAARRRASRCSPSPSAGPRTWCRPRVKAVPLGQSAGQRILARAGRRDPGAPSTRALALPATTIARPSRRMLAILSARHETQYSRLFRS